MVYYFRRISSFFIVYLLFSAVFVAIFVLVAGFVSFPLRFGNLGIVSSTCKSAVLDPAVLEVAGKSHPGIVWHATGYCDRLLFGISRDRVAVLQHVQRQGAMTQTASVTLPVDASGKPESAIYVDWVGWLLMIAVWVLLVSSHFQATPGMKLLKLKLADVHGERVGSIRAAARCAILLAIVSLNAIIITFGLQYAFANQGGVGSMLFVGGMVLLLNFFVFFPWWAMRRLPHAPLFDIMAGTRMLRAA